MKAMSMVTVQRIRVFWHGFPRAYRVKISGLLIVVASFKCIFWHLSLVLDEVVLHSIYIRPISLRLILLLCFISTLAAAPARTRI